MNLETRICALAELGRSLETNAGELVHGIAFTNPWFNSREVIRAIRNWLPLLNKDILRHWLYPYLPLEPEQIADILVISAGNIPLVGFHDFLCVLLSGNRYIGKLSSRDNQLLPILAKELIRIEPRFSDKICFTEDPTHLKGVIATGGNNTGRYFIRNFKHFPHLIRKNRTSAAFLTGSETTSEYQLLAADILDYYGLGCRSISHVLVPKGESLVRFQDVLYSFSAIDPNRMYLDNINYQAARLTVADTPFIRTPNLLLVEDRSIFSPIGVLHYSYYEDILDLNDFFSKHADNLQCMVGMGYIPFGDAQKPALTDYSDNLDTIAFLKSINS